MKGRTKIVAVIVIVALIAGGVLAIVVMLSGNSLATDIIDRLIGLLFLSFFYAPVDIAVRVRSFFKHKHSPAIRP